jgi:hypothetical protein
MSSNIVSVSWGDHLVFGEGEGRLATAKAIARRMKRWRKELGADTLHWRAPKVALAGEYQKAEDYSETIQQRTKSELNFFKQVPEIAHRKGLKAYLYVSLFDEGFPLASWQVRQESYHNAMHGQHIAWQSSFSSRHPEYALVDRSGEKRQWGVLCLAYPQVREHLIRRFRGLLQRGDWDGLFLCLRSQSRPANYADQFGFNVPIRRDFKARYGRDIETQDFDIQFWRDLRSEYLSQMILEVRELTDDLTVRFALGLPRGDVLGPPMDNRIIAWRQWVREGLVDELIINQNSAVCPSMWHPLWPMHRGYGYFQNYLDGFNLPPLLEQISESYSPVISRDGHTRLFVARQWDHRSEKDERTLLDHPAVSGLVFSSFRFDNPEAVARGDWTA